MPIFLDRHDLSGHTAADIAEAHRRDLEIQDRYGVRFLTYWFDESRRSGFCLIDAPDKELARKVHHEAHGDVAEDIIEVDLTAVYAFLGRLADPGTGGSPRQAIGSAYRAVMFTDMVGSTELTSRVGDQRSVELLRAHDGFLRLSLRETGGREVKHTGDGMMASFEDAVAAVRCACIAVERIRRLAEESGENLEIRIGIHAGEPIEDSRDLFGSTVQLAARICAAAEPGAILISSEMKEAVAGKFALAALDPVQLKGFGGVSLYRVLTDRG